MEDTSKSREKKKAILKFKEKDLRHNIEILCENRAETIPGLPSLISKGDYFYFILNDISSVENLDVRGEFI